MEHVGRCSRCAGHRHRTDVLEISLPIYCSRQDVHYTDEEVEAQRGRGPRSHPRWTWTVNLVIVALKFTFSASTPVLGGRLGDGQHLPISKTGNPGGTGGIGFVCVICPVVGGLGLCVENVTLSCLPQYMEGGRNIYVFKALRRAERGGWYAVRGWEEGSGQWVLPEDDLRGPPGGLSSSQDPRPSRSNHMQV